MPKGNYKYRKQRIFLYSVAETIIQVLWYLFWFILIVRQRLRPFRRIQRTA